ncbi:hypothetical protein HK102_005792 [Quaeritorhiza haematococci]|nr:hypothetical protein HK102_005792 [Quaeritorhiza haematococci]
MPVWSFNPSIYSNTSTLQSSWASTALASLPSTLFSSPSLQVLDIGCMDGKVTNSIAQILTSGGRVVGIDVNEEVIEFARKTYATEGKGGTGRDGGAKLEFEAVDALALPEEWTGTFDLVFSSSCLHWIHDHPLLLRHIHRCLKTGGTFRAVFHGEGTMAELIRVVEEVCVSGMWKGFFEVTKTKEGRVDVGDPWTFHGEEVYTSMVKEMKGWDIKMLKLEATPQYFTKQQLFNRIKGGWVPYTSKVPSHQQDDFITDIVDAYFHQFGQTVSQHENDNKIADTTTSSSGSLVALCVSNLMQLHLIKT